MASCRPAYVFFDNKLVAQTTPAKQLLYLKGLVVPGNAALGYHQISVSCTTAGSRTKVVSASLDVTATRNHLSEFSVAMPSPGQLGHHLASAGGISVLALLLGRIAAAGFPSEWLDRTYEANRGRFGRRLRQRLSRFRRHREVARSPWRRFVGGLGVFGAFVIVAGLINSVLDPAFGFNRTTLWLFLGQSLGVAMITLTFQLPVAIVGMRAKREVHLQVLVGGVVIAAACVAVSRLIGLSPGYCYGLIAAFLLRPEASEEDEGRTHAISSVCVLIVSTAAFFLTVPVFRAATSSHPSPWLLVLDPALNVTFLAGFASLAFGMFPLPFLPGRHLAKWNETAWLAITGAGLIGFVAVILTPGSGSPSELHHVGLIPMVAAFVVFALASLGFMLYFRLRPSPALDGESEVEASGEFRGITGPNMAAD
jgi:hypothetical protein